MYNNYELEQLAQQVKEDMEKRNREAWKLVPAERPTRRLLRLFHRRKAECGNVVRPE